MSTPEGLPQEVQLEVLSFVVRDKLILARFSAALSEAHFDNPIHRLLYRLVKSHFEEFKRVPMQSTLQQEVQRVLNEKEGFIPDSYFWAEFKRVYATPLSDREYIIGRVQDFLVRSEVSELAKVAEAATKSVDKISTRELDMQYKKICSVVSGGGSDDGEYLFKNLESRVFIEEKIVKVPTGFPKLDRITAGGLGKEEMGVVIAPTGYGKSTLLGQLGLNAARFMKKVLHITLEMSREKVIARYIASGTKVKKDDLYDMQTSVRTKLRRLQKLVGRADVFVKGWPTGYATIDMIRGFVQLLRIRDEFVPDLIILDYADLIKMDYSKMREQRHILGTLYEQVRGLAQELSIPIWTGSQTNRVALSKPIISIVDISESFQKAMIADIVLSICRTRQERRIHEGRLFVAKNRDNISEVMISIKEDFSTNRFWEISNPTITQEQFEIMQRRYEEGVND